MDEYRTPLAWPAVDFPTPPFPWKHFLATAVPLAALLIGTASLLANQLFVIIGLPILFGFLVFDLFRTLARRERQLYAEWLLRAEAGEVEALFFSGLHLVQARIRAHHASLAGFTLSGLPLKESRVPEADTGIRYLSRAAEAGHAMAQCALGKCYADGLGVPADVRVAVEWLRRAAEQGQVEAQRNLGRVFQYGLTGTRDPREARRWYQMAVAQGDEYAEEALRKLGRDN